MTDKRDLSYSDFEASIEDLYKSFPIVMRDKPVVSVMEGWHGLIADCASEIEREISRSTEYEDPESYPKIVDIKEKYGSLRIVVSYATEDIFHITSKYENLSMQICETCGRPGRLTKKGWIRSTCDIHE